MIRRLVNWAVPASALRLTVHPFEAVGWTSSVTPDGVRLWYPIGRRPR